MTWQSLIWAGVLGVSMTGAATGAARAQGCPVVAGDETAVADTLRTMYVAASTDDVVKFHSVAASSFYAYDGGKVFHGDELMELIQGSHAKGMKWVWTVTEPQVHVDCDMAWITYVNRGSVGDASGVKEMVWLESAMLRREKGGWKIQFFHSTRAV